MQLYLPFDTETTGLPNPKLDLTHPAQPHLVALSALQITLPNGRIQQSTSKIVKPDGWIWDDSSESEDRAFQTHRLTMEYCTREGRLEKELLDECLHLWDNRCHLIAHNLTFDRMIISIAIARYYPNEPALLRAWQDTPGVCTAKENKERVDARNVKGHRKPMPNLLETYQHFFPEETIERAHSANADAVAVYRIFLAMQEV